MFGLSASEILLIGLIALVLFGNEKLPENLKKFAQGASKAKSVLFDINNQWREMKDDIKKNIEFDDNFKKSISFHDEKKIFKELVQPIEIVSQIETIHVPKLEDKTHQTVDKV